MADSDESGHDVCLAEDGSPNPQTPPLAEGKTHHIFISNAEEDNTWAEALINKLEKDKGLKCMWYKRDFRPGRSTISNIQDCLSCCMKFVFILSPDFQDSEWCKQEIDWAVGMSIGEGRCLTVPILLKPCKIPSVFSTFHYIDVPRGDDVINRIMQSFDPEDDLQRMVASQVVFIPQTGNGQIIPIKAKKIDPSGIRGTAWSFSPYSELNQKAIDKQGIKFEDDLYNRARSILNESTHLKYFSLGTKSWQWFLFPLCLMLIDIFVHMLVGVVILTVTEEFGYTHYLHISLWLLFIAIPVIIHTYLGRWYREACGKIVQLSVDHIKETSTLVFYTYTDSIISFFYCTPKVWIMCYDVNPCLEYVTSLILTHTEHGIDDEKTKAHARLTADMELKQYLRQNLKSLMINWGWNCDSVKRRHPTYLNKPCLCERMGY